MGIAIACQACVRSIVLLGSSATRTLSGSVPVHFFFGRQESIKLIEEETLEGVFARHARLAEATRECVRAWGANGKGPTLFGQTEDRLSNSVTTVMMPEGHTSDAMRKAELMKGYFDTAERVARDGLADCVRGKALSVPGAQYKGMVAISGVLPRRLLRRISGLVQRG